MKRAADFRAIARDSLKGKMGISLLAGLIASALGAVSSIQPTVGHAGISFHGNSSGTEVATQQMDPRAATLLAVILLVVFSIMLVYILAQLFIASIVLLGYSRFNLDLVDRQKQPSIGSIFKYFRYWKSAFCSQLLIGLYTLLWSMLFIIPGIVAAYSYAMTGYILAEHPELSASEAIDRSKEMMRGNRFRLFCLELSFIGWDLLCLLTCGVGSLWLTPYKYAAYAAFYREVSGTDFVPPTEPLLFPEQ